ncbi:scarecrow-like protein 15 [Dioscorea cayenensis subsp. rotundata]|uniref:Scarecrow-like protein 15 n=1 Tax=Dioscorea cayennensis subsp. rotundata TaxID=55577 RepID=A0AB40AXM8_DIOCR|nr:scarecrow-like protein 15 [Dioscorea cayenensis subsp. rotundata]
MKSTSDSPSPISSLELDFPSLKPPTSLSLPPTPFFYEPTSVLDPNLTSHDSHLTSSWDFPEPDWSFLLPDPQNPDYTLPPPPPLFDLSHLDLLLSAASHGSIISSLPSPALLSTAPPSFSKTLFPPSSPPLLPLSPSPIDLVRRISAHKSLSDLSPIPQFTSFTANQTLLESLVSTSSSIHLIDFDLSLGGQWSSFAQEIAARSRSSRSPPPSLRLTAILSDDSPDSSLAADNLRDFARSLGLRFSIDLVRVASLGTFALSSVRLSTADSTGVVLSPAIFRAIGPDPASSADLLRFIRRTSPRSVVFVDTEPCSSSPSSPPSFKRAMASGIEFYSSVLDSLDSAALATGLGDDHVRRIERFLIRPRVTSWVQACGAHPTPWRETLASAGFSPAPFSEFTESQAEWLLRRAPVDGFHVARRDGAMVLSWKGRDLASTSAWRC